ncbi:hypothetical protein R3P38DRAFT_3538310 [Favolaschia claudopus]|uniref:Uncharacterized protein n=1 Tax=Favolaschia claudopus TaxID=2862362 RepID=A0AAW0B951_9AGAR
MHVDLRLSSLNKLPIMKRRLAESMINMPLTRQSLAEFALLIDYSPSILSTGFAPVFYLLLDPTRIPQVDTLDSLAPNILYDFHLWSGFLSLNGLFTSRPSHETFEDLWPRISTWSYYIFQHEEFLCTALELGLMKEFYFQMMRFLGYISESARDKAIFLSDPKSQIFAARAYSCFSVPSDFLGYQWILDTPIRIILNEADVHLDNLLEGIRGDISDLARIVFRQCEVAVPPLATEMDLSEFVHLAVAFSIIVRTDKSRADLEKPKASEQRPDLLRPLCAALVPLGFTRTVTLAALTLSRIPVSKFNEAHRVIMVQCICFLKNCSEQDQGTLVVESALQHGLLDVLLAASNGKHFAPDTRLCVCDILVGVLTRFTLHYRALGKMDEFLASSIIDQAERLELSEGISDENVGSFVPCVSCH